MQCPPYKAYFYNNVVVWKNEETQQTVGDEHLPDFAIVDFTCLNKLNETIKLVRPRIFGDASIYEDNKKIYDWYDGEWKHV